VEGVNQRFVVGKNHEAAALKHIAEVADCCHDRQQLPVEGAVVRLGFVELG
jgi:hypothetical protein